MQPGSFSSLSNVRLSSTWFNQGMKVLSRSKPVSDILRTEVSAREALQYFKAEEAPVVNEEANKEVIRNALKEADVPAVVKPKRYFTLPRIALAIATLASILFAYARFFR